MGRLIVASNRVGDFKSGFQAGGLAVALGEVMKARGGLWFGSVDVEGSNPDIGVVREPAEGAEGVEFYRVPIGRDEYKAYYFGFANSILWPVFHNRIDLARFDNGFYKSYRKVNERFADAIAQRAKPGDVIWVHDYHLIPLGAELRKRGVNNPIGFFLHIPFPPGDVFASVSQHEEITKTLAHYDLVGFQTMKDTAAFLNYAQRHAGGRIVSDGRLRIGAWSFVCASFPVGIDADEFARAAAEVEREPKGIPAFAADRNIHNIIGVDRLDYSKGLLQRFQAFGKFLEMNPHRHGQVTFTQIAPPTRQGLSPYKQMQNELERLAGSINGRFGNLGWVPIHYIHRGFPRHCLAGLFRSAKVGLVTPTQDGMNLVAKEYVAAQNEADPGVLVLSKFAGAAEELKDALIVNPYDIEECAQVIEQALQMPLKERCRRHAAMFDLVRSRDIHHWSGTFIGKLEDVAEQRASATIPAFIASDHFTSMARRKLRAASGSSVPRLGKPDDAKPVIAS